jgi:hypothetical protein
MVFSLSHSWEREKKTAPAQEPLRGAARALGQGRKIFRPWALKEEPHLLALIEI